MWEVNDQDVITMMKMVYIQDMTNNISNTFRLGSTNLSIDVHTDSTTTTKYRKQQLLLYGFNMELSVFAEFLAENGENENTFM